MPGLRSECVELISDNGREEHCCICNEGECSVALSDRGDTVLFIDGEEIDVGGNHCDCIVVLKRDSRLEVYSVELKDIRARKWQGLEDALNPDKLRNKWCNCFRWIERIVKGFRSSDSGNNVTYYAILAIPKEALHNVLNTSTLIKRREPPLRPPKAKEVRVIPCNSSITGNAIKVYPSGKS